jgi:diacylglycerol kinase (ATP)
MRMAVIYNPSSRRGTHTAARVREALARLDSGAAARWLELREVAALPLDCERVVCIGGDGTINAVASSLERSGASCPLAVIPAGTGNNLARGLGLPLETRAAVRLAVAGSSLRAIDGIAYEAADGGERRLIVQTSALGFPAEIAAQYDRLRRHRLFRLAARPTGPYVYRLLALLGLVAQKRRERRGEPPLVVSLKLPGEHLEESVFAVFIGNERSLGGNFHPCPKAVPDDGQLDICMIRAGTGEAYLRVFRRVARGAHLDLERTVVYRQTPGPVEIDLSSPLPLLADGDLWVRSDRYRLEVLPRRFRIVVPGTTS